MMYLPPRVINYTTSKPARSRALLVQSMEPTALFFRVCMGATNKTKPSHPTPFRAGFGLTTVHDSSFVVRPRDTRASTRGRTRRDGRTGWRDTHAHDDDDDDDRPTRFRQGVLRRRFRPQQVARRPCGACAKSDRAFDSIPERGRMMDTRREIRRRRPGRMDERMDGRTE